MSRQTPTIQQIQAYLRAHNLTLAELQAQMDWPATVLAWCAEEEGARPQTKREETPR